jgi:hypothetical protein
MAPHGATYCVVQSSRHGGKAHRRRGRRCLARRWRAENRCVVACLASGRFSLAEMTPTRLWPSRAEYSAVSFPYWGPVNGSQPLSLFRTRARARCIALSPQRETPSGAKERKASRLPLLPRPPLSAPVALDTPHQLGAQFRGGTVLPPLSDCCHGAARAVGPQ